MRDGRFPYEVVNGVPVVAAPEEIDITNAPDLRTTLMKAAADGHGTLVLDMTQTRFCDSSGIHTLLAVHKRAQAGGGELRLVIPDPPALRIFAITGIDRVIPNVTSLEEALARTSASGSNGHALVPVPGRPRQLGHDRLRPGHLNFAAATACGNAPIGQRGGTRAVWVAMPGAADGSLQPPSERKTHVYRHRDRRSHHHHRGCRPGPAQVVGPQPARTLPRRGSRTGTRCPGPAADLRS